MSFDFEKAVQAANNNIAAKKDARAETRAQMMPMIQALQETFKQLGLSSEGKWDGEKAGSAYSSARFKPFKSSSTNAYSIEIVISSGNGDKISVFAEGLASRGQRSNFGYFHTNSSKKTALGSSDKPSNPQEILNSVLGYILKHAEANEIHLKTSTPAITKKEQPARKPLRAIIPAILPTMALATTKPAATKTDITTSINQVIAKNSEGEAMLIGQSIFERSAILAERSIELGGSAHIACVTAAEKMQHRVSELSAVQQFIAAKRSDIAALAAPTGTMAPVVNVIRAIVPALDPKNNLLSQMREVREEIADTLREVSAITTGHEALRKELETNHQQTIDLHDALAKAVAGLERDLKDEKLPIATRKSKQGIYELFLQAQEMCAPHILISLQNQTGVDATIDTQREFAKSILTSQSAWTMVMGLMGDTLNRFRAVAEPRREQAEKALIEKFSDIGAQLSYLSTTLTAHANQLADQSAKLTPTPERSLPAPLRNRGGVMMD